MCQGWYGKNCPEGIHLRLGRITCGRISMRPLQNCNASGPQCCHRRPPKNGPSDLNRFSSHRCMAKRSASLLPSMVSSRRSWRSTEVAPEAYRRRGGEPVPRIRRIENADVRAVLVRIDSLEEEHARADRSHGEVDHLSRLWPRDGRLPTEQASAPNSAGPVAGPISP